MATEVVATRRRIIRRPRLTSMLDESSARIRLLIAPAGYGKTTLAREWLGEPERRDVWYRGGPASADVAAIAAGVSEAVGAIVPDAGKRMLERLRATGHPEEDVDILAELFAEDVQKWPADAWLAIDDYQFAMDSVASERFIDLLTQTTPIQMLIASRRRPSWATARRILYGEIQEIDRRSLAMERNEAQQVVGRTDSDLSPVLDQAQGWPAVVGLVDVSSTSLDLTGAFPETLYEYFAQELFDGLPRGHRAALGRLAFVSSFDRAFARDLVGKQVDGILGSGVRAGALSQRDYRFFEFHPLFADFLLERTFESLAAKHNAAVNAGYALLRSRRWDEALEIAIRFSIRDLLVATVEDSLDSMLDSGRVATLVRWLEAAAGMQADSPVFDLAEAELAFRIGDYRRAEVLAEHAAQRLGPTSRLISQAHVRAGHAALLGSREEASVRHFEKARETSRDPRATREALFGLYSALSELEWPEASEVLVELDQLELDSPDDQLRAMIARLTNAVRAGGIEPSIDAALATSTTPERASNPLIITSYLHALSNASNSTARYEDGLRFAKELLSIGTRHRLEFVRPFGVIDRAIAHLGLRSFADANHDLELVARLAPLDVHIQGNVALQRCRLLLATGRPTAAAEATELGVFDERPSAPLQAEILSYRGLAHACNGARTLGLRNLEEAEGTSKTTLVVRVLSPAIRGICSQSASKRGEHAEELWAVASQTGNFDTLVFACRAYPDLLDGVARVADRDRLISLLGGANDTELADRYGIGVHRRNRSGSMNLTPRETEIMDLVAAGLSNREIAESLFITESTVKAHLRHAYEKLRVRGRAEAVPKWLTRH